EPNVSTLASTNDLIEYVILSRRDWRAAEPLRKLQIFAIFAGLATADSQFRIARTDAGEPLGYAFGRKTLHDVNEWPARPDRRKLAWVTDQDESVHAPERLNKRAEHLLSEHGRLIDDHRVSAGFGRLLREAVAPGRTIVAMRTQELRDGIALELEAL